MTTMTQHKQGTFCWPELYVPDIDEGKKFYTSLLGWTFNDTPMPPESGGGVYTIFQLGGRDVAAMYILGPEMQKAGMPPNWGTYIAVDDVDASVKKATELGAKVIVPPMDVMGTLGRFSALMDPTGAVFSVWQAGTHIGVQVRDEPGAMTWNELLTRDAGKAKTFYASLFGYRVQDMPTPEGEYTVFSDAQENANRGGMMQILPRMGEMPSNWLTYFETTDLRKSVDKAKSLGAEVFVDVTPIPQWGQFAVLADPQGAAFALFQRNA